MYKAKQQKAKIQIGLSGRRRSNVQYFIRLSACTQSLPLFILSLVIYNNHLTTQRVMGNPYELPFPFLNILF